MPRSAKFLILLGTLAFMLAACGLALPLPTTPHILVMLDLSPSTRTATYRDSTILNHRLAQLLGNIPYRIETFGENADETTFTPPPADDILLFSDARFATPAFSPPTYIVIDPNLENPPDAAVTRLECNGHRVTAAVHNAGPPREFHPQNLITTVPTGNQLITTDIDPAATNISAYFTSSDAWPENDSLTLPLPPPEKLQRWWFGSSPPPGWMQLTSLPTNPMAYLAASIIALNNIPAADIPNQDPLLQYVRDCGGSLLILGGEHAFAAGAYPGTNLESLSPLSSFPPQPQRNWILLVDASGSMASRWPDAIATITQIPQHLPPHDLVSVGSFARNLHWWLQSQSAETLKLSPPNISPSGPTNVQPVLESIASQLDGSAITEIILISDADATIDNPAAIAATLSQKKIHLNLLATADLANSPLPQIVKLTGGQIASQRDPHFWNIAAEQLLRATSPSYVEQSLLTVVFSPSQSTRILSGWNQTWLKTGATALAASNQITLAARWRIGAGQVAAIAFTPIASEIAATTALIETPPRDPRFHVSFSAASRFSVSIDATDSNHYLNDLNATLDLLDQTSRHAVSPIPQTAPGRYEISLPAPRSPMLAIVRVNDQIIQRFAVPARYAPEFGAIGNDHDAMRSLADRSGGAVIPPTQITPIDFHKPTRRVPLVSWLSALGAMLIAAGLLVWKFRA